MNNCSLLANCSTCIVEPACDWMSAACVVAENRTQSTNRTCVGVDADPISTAALLFDPAMLVLLLSIAGALLVGARRSVRAAAAVGASAEATREMQVRLRDMRFTWKRAATVLVIPAVGSAVLLLFFFFTEIVYYVLLCITTFAGLMGVHNLLAPWLTALRDRVPLLRREVSLLRRWTCDVGALVAVLLTVLLVSMWLSSNFWALINMVALAIGISALERAPLPSARFTIILGALLLVYDCFWVFSTFLHAPAPPPTPFPTMFNATMAPTPMPTSKGESAMLRLAMGILRDSKGCEVATLAFFRPCWPSLPMLTVFPRFLSHGFNAVGLGDLIVPGLHVAVLARYDGWLKRTWRTGYFWLSFAGYCVGLVMAMVVALVFRSGQPALLYLIPLVHVPPLIAAAARRELRVYWFGRRPREEAVVRDTVVEEVALTDTATAPTSDAASAGLLENAETRE
jgi:signal peptide peptidase-like protein 2A